MKRKAQNEKSPPKTPNSKVAKLLGNEKVSPVIRKQLLYGEVINQELTQSFDTLKKSQRGRKMFYSVFKGKILKKYRLINLASANFCRYKSIKNAISKADFENRTYTFKCEKRGNYLIDWKKTAIENFYERDDNSKLLPGKKDCLTRNKEKRQKRLLCETMKALYAKFLSEVDYYVSYTLFVQLKPFHVKSPRVEDRNTCACLLHVNTAAVVAKLHEEGVFSNSRGSDLLSALYCNQQSGACLSRECGSCKSKEIIYNIEDTEKEVSVKKWVNEKQTIVVKCKEKLVRKPIKKEFTQTLKCLVIGFDANIFPKYLTHVKNIAHQYKELTKKRRNLMKVLLIYT